jgi:hypothetical protein
MLRQQQPQEQKAAPSATRSFRGVDAIKSRVFDSDDGNEPSSNVFFDTANGN